MTSFLAGILAGDGQLIVLLSLVFLNALLSLDDVALAQTWFGQPLPAAVLTGLVCGDPGLGLVIGLPLQLILVGNLPVGRTFSGDPTTAAVSVVGGMALSGSPIALTGLGDPIWTGLDLVGWLLLGSVLVSFTGNWLINLQRQAHLLWMHSGHRVLRDGKLNRIEAIQLRCMGATFLRGTVLGLLFILVIARVWIPLFEILPPRLGLALGILPLLVPGLGIGTMIDRYGLRASSLWVLAGLLVPLILRGVLGWV